VGLRASIGLVCATVVAAALATLVLLACAESSHPAPSSGECVEPCRPVLVRAVLPIHDGGELDAAVPDAALPPPTGPDDAGNFPDVTLPEPTPPL
jgi:hypothetical protein